MMNCKQEIKIQSKRASKHDPIFTHLNIDYSLLNNCREKLYVVKKSS